MRRVMAPLSYDKTSKPRAPGTIESRVGSCLSGNRFLRTHADLHHDELDELG